MNLYQLRYFVVLAHLEHYTRAAEELNITQPSLSHAISSLEEELGVPLFDRVGRNVSLTRNGRIFLAETEHALSILDKGVDRLQRISRGEDVIDLGFLRGMSNMLVPDVVAAFQATEQGKRVSFRFSTDNTQGLLEGLERQRYDLVFCSKEKAPQAEFHPVARLPFYLVVPEAHPLAARSVISLEETLDEPHILFDQTAAIRTVIDRLYARLPRQPKVAYEMQEDQDIAGLVAHRFGVAVLPKITILGSLPVKAIPLAEQDIQRELYLAAPANRSRTPAAEAFLRFVLRYTREKVLVPASQP